jgi:hypothetical protein
MEVANTLAYNDSATIAAAKNIYSSGSVITILHFLRNLPTGPIS